MAVPICATKMRFMDCHYALLLSVTLLWLQFGAMVLHFVVESTQKNDA